MNTNTWKINRLKRLLEGRKREYEIFGRTAEDAERDAEILREIKELESAKPL